jgi:hypothetical protein
MAMENPPFVGDFPIKISPFMGQYGAFPLPRLITRGYLRMIPHKFPYIYNGQKHPADNRI